MRDLVLTPKFKRSYRKLVRRNPALQRRIDETLRTMEEDIYARRLGAHKLSGALSGLSACACGYDCRIVFALIFDEETGQEVILLLDIGTHDEVY
jgi:mRNA interferase YafQ